MQKIGSQTCKHKSHERDITDVIIFKCILLSIQFLRDVFLNITSKNVLQLSFLSPLSLLCSASQAGLFGAGVFGCPSESSWVGAGPSGQCTVVRRLPRRGSGGE